MIEFLKKYRKVVMKMVLALAIAWAFLGGCSYLNKRFNLEDDNIIEEAIEHQIEEHSGVDLDLTPESPEK